MRIALQYCGLPRWNRTVLQAQLSQLRIPPDARLDVFLAFWRVDGVDYGSLTREAAETFGTIPAAMNVIDGYVPAIPGNAVRYVEVRPENVYKMFRAIAHVNALRKTHQHASGTAYDIVIRSRTDLVLSRPLPLRKLAAIAQHCPVLPANGHWRGGLNDQFAIAAPADMDHYSGVHDCLNTYLAQGRPLHPELMLRWHLEAAGLAPVFADFRTELHRESPPAPPRVGPTSTTRLESAPC